ncbi:MAG: acetate--CoA ligase family protein [Anaerolineae bacterium]|nr:acetate--CoA ligase family protein [Anaerolineae bacterium]
MSLALPAAPADLEPFFAPTGVALIGASATPGKLGYGVLQNLVGHGYRAPVYPVHPTHTAILGLPCYAEVAAVPDPVDLAVILIPAPAVPEALAACGRRGIRAAIVLSGGFAESGPEGAARQEALVATARRFGIRLLGPNCVGVLAAHTGFNATFIGRMPPRGAIALISQSGAVGGALIDWACGQGVGLSYFVSLGNRADVSEAELLAYLAHDRRTAVIALYLEGLDEGRRFLEAARVVGRRKPIVVLKAGATEAGARAVASHTASLAGTDAVYRAALRQAGLLQADTTADLFGIAQGLAYQPPPTGPRVAILTNAGGPGAIAADAVARRGLTVAPPSPEAAARLRAALGPLPQLANPFDLLGAASTHEYETAARLLLDESEYDALLAVLVPNTANDPVGVADGLARAAAAPPAAQRKPVFVCYMGDVSLRAGRRRLHRRRLPAYAFPEDAATALAAAHAWRCPLPPPAAAAVPAWTAAVAQGLKTLGDRGTLGEADLYPLLQSAGFPVAAWATATSAAEAVAQAERLGFPVVLKVVAPGLLHKSDVGGVLTGLTDATAVAAGFEALLTRLAAARPDCQPSGVLVQKMAPPPLTEVILGLNRDPVFGPVLLFGGGGLFVEAYGDRSLRLAPIGEADARAMMAETVVGRLLAGARGRPRGDEEALVALLMRLSALAVAVPSLREFEFNPVFVYPAGQGLTIVDARAILSP